MKILFCTPHFDGHRLAIEAFHKFCVETWNFVETELLVLDNSSNPCAVAMEFTLLKISQDLDRLAEISPPDLIVYDFFAIAALIYARRHGIPTICSIPAIVDPEPNKEYLQSCKEKYRIVLDLYPELPEPELLSDGWLFRGDQNIVWSYKGLYEGAHGSAPEGFHFVGSMGALRSPNPLASQVPGAATLQHVYMSLGTVVPNSYYHYATEHERARIFQIYQTVIQYFAGTQYHLTVSCPLPLPCLSPYSNVTVYPYCDQLAMLSRSQLFVTHGGGNGLNEALMVNCPMLVIPFFGDQHVTARLVDGRFGKHCKSTEPVELRHDLDDVLYRLSEYRMNLEYVKPYDEHYQNVCKLRSLIDEHIAFPRIWRSYDLLYGTTAERAKMVQYYGMEALFRIGAVADGDYLTVEKLGIVPALIDQWNDLLRQYTVQEIGLLPEHLSSLVLHYRDYLIQNGISTEARLGHRDAVVKTLAERKVIQDKELIDLCCAGVDFFAQQGSRIHFVLDNIDTSVNLATTQEYMYCLDRGMPCVYWTRSQTENGYRIAYPTRPYRVPDGAQEALDELVRKIRELTGQQPQARLKSLVSIERKRRNARELNDILGLRLLCRTTEEVQDMALRIQDSLNMSCSFTEQGRVAHLHGVHPAGAAHTDCPFEVQIWTEVLYRNFEEEHDNVYKAEHRTPYSIAKSIAGRHRSHAVQDEVDASGVAPQARRGWGT